MTEENKTVECSCPILEAWKKSEELRQVQKERWDKMEEKRTAHEWVNMPEHLKKILKRWHKYCESWWGYNDSEDFHLIRWLDANGYIKIEAEEVRG